MTRLVTPEGTRAVVDHQELLVAVGRPGEVERILDQLVRARLIHLHTDPDQGATVEIVHEVLITEWPTLRRWLEDSQALRGFLHELRQATKQWAARGSRTISCGAARTAQDALATANRHVLDLSASERDFLAAVRKQAARARGRRGSRCSPASSRRSMLVIAGGAVAFVRITPPSARPSAGARRRRSARTRQGAPGRRGRDHEGPGPARRGQARAGEGARGERREGRRPRPSSSRRRPRSSTPTRRSSSRRRKSSSSANAELKHALADAQGAKKARRGERRPGEEGDRGGARRPRPSPSALLARAGSAREAARGREEARSTTATCSTDGHERRSKALLVAARCSPRHAPYAEPKPWATGVPHRQAGPGERAVRRGQPAVRAAGARAARSRSTRRRSRCGTTR